MLTLFSNTSKNQPPLLTESLTESAKTPQSDGYKRIEMFFLRFWCQNQED